MQDYSKIQKQFNKTKKEITTSGWEQNELEGDETYQ